MGDSVENESFLMGDSVENESFLMGDSVENESFLMGDLTKLNIVILFFLFNFKYKSITNLFVILNKFKINT